VKIAIVDDAGFGLGSGRGVYGKESYSGIFSTIYREQLGLDMVKAL